jgi:hypothetical protein
LILPMYRVDDCGEIRNHGSIDTGTTKECVVSILEGGTAAFMKRKEIYNY